MARATCSSARAAITANERLRIARIATLDELLELGGHATVDVEGTGVGMNGDGADVVPLDLATTAHRREESTRCRALILTVVDEEADLARLTRTHV